MKKILTFSTVLLSIAFLSCEKTKAEKENLGRQAAHEFCECYEKKSAETCFEELKDNYNSVDYMNDNFISAFNDESHCGITLKKEYIGSKAAVEPTIIDETGF